MFKTRLDTFGNDFGHFCNFGKFLIFLKIFEDSTLHGTLGKKKFSKKLPQNMFKNVWTNFWERFWAIFWNFEKFFDFFENFRRLDPPWNTGQKEFSKTRPTKAHFFRKNRFGHFWERFWAKKFFMFENFRQTRPSMGKKCQNTFGHFWERFWAFLQFWKFLIFLKIFEDSTLHGTLGKKKFSKKLTQNMFKTRLDTFGNDFGHFWNFESFWFFWKFSKTRPSMEHWAKKIFEKITPKHVQNTFEDFWERF